MSTTHISDETYEGQDFSESPLAKGEYDNCEFKNCTFANGDLSGIVFFSCTFGTCDLSMTSLKETGFQKVSFDNCKMMGLRLEDCNRFLLNIAFTECNISYCSFIDLQLSKIRFKDCLIIESDFETTNLKESIFSNCSLERSKFIQCNLEDSDLSTATHFIIDPSQNKMSGALVSKEGAQGLLVGFGIELC